MLEILGISACIVLIIPFAIISINYKSFFCTFCLARSKRNNSTSDSHHYEDVEGFPQSEISNDTSVENHYNVIHEQETVEAHEIAEIKTQTAVNNGNDLNNDNLPVRHESTLTGQDADEPDYNHNQNNHQDHNYPLHIQSTSAPENRYKQDKNCEIRNDQSRQNTQSVHSPHQESNSSSEDKESLFNKTVQVKEKFAEQNTQSDQQTPQSLNTAPSPTRPVTPPSSQENVQIYSALNLNNLNISQIQFNEDVAAAFNEPMYMENVAKHQRYDVISVREPLAKVLANREIRQAIITTNSRNCSGSGSSSPSSSQIGPIYAKCEPQRKHPLDNSNIDLAPNSSRHSPLPSTSASASTKHVSDPVGAYGMRPLSGAVYSVPHKKTPPQSTVESIQGQTSSNLINDPGYTEIDGERNSSFYEEINNGSTTYSQGSSATYDQIDERRVTNHHYQQAAGRIGDETHTLVVSGGRNCDEPIPPLPNEHHFLRHLNINIAPNPSRYSQSLSAHNSPSTSSNSSNPKIRTDAIYSVPDKKTNNNNMTTGSSDPEYTEVDGERNSCFYEEIAGGSIVEPNYEVIRPQVRGTSSDSDDHYERGDGT